MTDAVTATPAPLPGLLARAVGVVVAPTAMFEKIVQTPRAAGILFFVAALMAVAVGGPQLTERGRQAALDMQVQQTEKLSGQAVSDQQYATMEKMSRYGAYFVAGSMLIFLPVMALIVAAVYFVIFNALLGGTATFRQVLAINTHSMVITALGTLLGAPIQYFKGVVTNAGPFNLGALVPMLPERSFLANFLGSISVFTVWGIIVTSIGLGVLYKRKSVNIAIGIFIVMGLIAGGWAYWVSR